MTVSCWKRRFSCCRHPTLTERKSDPIGLGVAIVRAGRAVAFGPDQEPSRRACAIHGVPAGADLPRIVGIFIEPKAIAPALLVDWLEGAALGLSAERIRSRRADDIGLCVLAVDVCAVGDAGDPRRCTVVGTGYGEGAGLSPAWRVDAAGLFDPPQHRRVEAVPPDMILNDPFWQTPPCIVEFPGAALGKVA